MIRYPVVLLPVTLLVLPLCAVDQDAAKRIADLEKRVVTSKTFDFELHNALRHEYHFSGQTDKEIEQCDIIFQHLTMNSYTLDCLGAKEAKREDAIRLLTAVADKHPKRVYAATACRLKVAILTEDKGARAALLYPLLDLQDPKLKAYLKEAKVRYADVVPATRRPPEVQRLRILLAMDTDSNLKGLVEYELKNFLEIFDEIKKGREDKFTIEVMKGKDLSPDALLKYYEKLEVVPGDGMFFYYSGHGAWDTASVDRDGRKVEKGHILSMTHGRLLRYELVDQILAKKPVAAFVFSDACSNTGQFNVLERRRPAEWLAFRDLFFQHAGLFNVTAASRDELAYGPMFTDAFQQLLCEPRSAIRKDGKEGSVGWVNFYEKLVERTQNNFLTRQKQAREEIKTPRVELDFRDAKVHTPQAFDLGYWPWVRGGNLPAGLWPQLGHPAAHRMIPSCVALSPDGGWSMIYGHGGFGCGGVTKEHTDEFARLAKAKRYAKHVALGEKGRWGVVTSDNDVVGENLPESLKDDVEKLRTKKVTITSLALGPNDSWAVVISGPGGTAVVSDGLPKKLDEVLDGLGKRGARIQDVALSPTGGWVVLHGTNQFDSDQVPRPLENDLKALSGLGYRLHTVSLGPDDGWVVVYRPQ